MQMLFDNVQEEILAARIRRVQCLMSELMSDIESKTMTREELTQKVKHVEKNLRKTRDDI